MTGYSRNHRATRLACGIVSIVAVSIAIPWVAANDEIPAVRHFLDSFTDRVPAQTSFPEYPSVARRDRIEGEATVCFKIKANGKISRLSVQSSTHRIFSKPALRAMKASSFEPLAPGEILSPTKTCRTYRFRLDPIIASGDTS